MSDRESPLQRRVTDALKYSSRRLSDYRLQCHQIITWKFSFHDLIKSLTNHKTSRGVVVITTAQLYSTKPELRFCTGSNPVRGCRGSTMVKISDNGPGWK